MKTLFISPDSDDACLFGCYTLMREHPLVLTVLDGYIQQNRGENITHTQRRMEDINAMRLLDCSLIFGGIRDDAADKWSLMRLFQSFANFDLVYIPALQGGNPRHDLVSEVASSFFSRFRYYATYKKGETYSPLENGFEVVPTEAEFELKCKAMDEYKSQKDLLSTFPHFAKVRQVRSEWLSGKRDNSLENYGKVWSPSQK